MTLPKARLKDVVLSSIGRLSLPLRQDVLADRVITDEFKIGTNNPIRLAGDFAFDRHILFQAFQRCVDGLELQPLQTMAGSTFQGKVSVDENGTGIVEYDNHRASFEGAGLFS